MPVKIRLQRRGRKFAKIYNIVVADGRAPRDGKYIENLGQYDPSTNPATIQLDFDRSLEWLQNGAQPTDTCRGILSLKGVMYKKHLLEGVKKGAFDEAEAERRFQTWMKEKETKIQSKADQLQSEKDAAKQERLAAETKIKEERALEIQKQRSALLKEAQSESSESTEDEGVTETVAEEPKEAKPEAPKTEEKPAEEKKEEPKEVEKQEEPKEEPKAESKEEPKEEPKAESKEEPKEEPKAESKEEPKADDASEEEKK